MRPAFWEQGSTRLGDHRGIPDFVRFCFCGAIGSAALESLR